MRINRSQERLFTWAVPVILACVLVGLAVLQYVWSGQISEAANTRLRSSLQTSMMSFRQDLSREVGTLCLELQLEPGTSALNGKELAQKLQLWQRTSSVPDLPANVYFWTVTHSGGTALLRLVLPEGRFQSVDWPPQFQRLRQVLSSRPPGQLRASAPGPASAQELHPPNLAPAPPIGGIDQSIPVLALPMAPDSRSGTSWLLVELDSHVLQQQLYPQLAARYFGDARTSNYDVAVVAAGSGQPLVLYASDPGFLKRGDFNGDSSLNLFGPPAPRGGAPQFSFDPLRFSGFSTQGFRGPAPGNNGSTFGPIRFDPIHSEGNELDWRLVVKHRKGSIAAAAAELRHRNLALSFGVLLVLAASMALIILNSTRARRLAMLQMDFVAGVSHELRTPVAAILSISDNLATGIVNDKQQVIAYGDLVRNQARQLNCLIEQVLSFSAATKKANKYRFSPVQISKIIDKALENTAVLIAASGVEVHSTIEPGVPAVYTDPGALSQALQNLIINAVKYGGDAKWMSIRAAIDGSSGVPEVIITVADRGIGIAPESLKHIFDPFYRSPQVAESEIHGTGLGLALAKSFVGALGGSITVRSELGKGSAFTIHLPLKGSQFGQNSEVEQESLYL